MRNGQKALAKTLRHVPDYLIPTISLFGSWQSETDFKKSPKTYASLSLMLIIVSSTFSHFVVVAFLH